MVAFSRTDQPLTIADIVMVEKELGIKLPEDLRNHYLAYNGGRPEPRFFPKNGEWYGVHDFLAMRTSDKSISFEFFYQELVISNEYFPNGYIPFACDEGGDYFVYGSVGSDFGKIFIVQSEYFDDEERLVIFLADNLSSFLSALGTPDD